MVLGARGDTIMNGIIPNSQLRITSHTWHEVLNSPGENLDQSSPPKKLEFPKPVSIRRYSDLDHTW